MKVKYDPEATYVLLHPEDGTIRILCEANNTSMLGYKILVDDPGSIFKPSLATIKDFVDYCDYKIIQEWK